MELIFIEGFTTEEVSWADILYRIPPLLKLAFPAATWELLGENSII